VPRTRARSYGVLLDTDLLRASPLFRGSNRDELARAMEGLARLGLVIITSTECVDANLRRTALLPPLVRATNRVHPDVEARSGQYQDLLIALLESVIARCDLSDPRNWPLWNLLAPHCRGILQFVRGSAEKDTPERILRLSQPAHLAARYFQGAGFYARAAGHREVALIRRHALGDSDPHTLTARQHHALALRDEGRWGEAHAEYEGVLALRTQLLGQEHPDTLETRHGLASVLRREGFLDQAQVEYRAVLVMRSRILGDEHPDTLDTRHATAYLLRLRGQHVAAESEYRAVIAHQRAMVGDAHPTTLGTRHNLALVLQDQGRLDEAEEEYAEVLAIGQRLLGPAHHDTVDTRLGVVRALRQGGTPQPPSHE